MADFLFQHGRLDVVIWLVRNTREKDRLQVKTERTEKINKMYYILFLRKKNLEIFHRYFWVSLVLIPSQNSSYIILILWSIGAIYAFNGILIIFQQSINTHTHLWCFFFFLLKMYSGFLYIKKRSEV